MKPEPEPDLYEIVAEGLCRLCDRTRAEHRVAEREKVVHHFFSETGAMVRLDETSSSKLSPKGKVPGGDPILRFLMVDKGLITPEEIDAAEALLVATGLLSSRPKNGSDDND